MRFRIIPGLILICGLPVIPALAESADCLAPVVIIPDGRLLQGTFPQGVTYWYGVYGQAGHSYSVEFEPADNLYGAYHPLFGAIAVYGPTDTLSSCRGTSSVAVTPTSGCAPAIMRSGYGGGRRISFQAQTSGLFLINVTNSAASGSYTYRVVDTSLVNIRWNTLSGSDVQWVIMNLSEMSVTGTISLIDMSGQLILPVQISIPAGGRVSRSSAVSDLNLPRNLAGSALFSHNAPPGAISAEAFMIGTGTTMPERFAPVSNP